MSKVAIFQKANYAKTSHYCPVWVRFSVEKIQRIKGIIKKYKEPVKKAKWHGIMETLFSQANLNLLCI